MFLSASLTSAGSLPSLLTRHGPLASANATPNFTPGTEFAIAS